MEEWEERKSTDDYLLPPGVQLERGKALLATPGDVPIDDIRDFVERSIKKEDDRAAAEREAELADQKRIADAERQAKEAAEETAREATARAKAETDLRTAAEQKALAEQRARNDAEALAGTRKRMIVGAVAALLVMAALGVFSLVQWRNADRSLTLATNAANAMVSDLAKSMRDRKGMPVELVQDILKRAQDLQQQLVDASGGRSDVLRSQAEALNEVVLTEFAAGDDAGALRAARAFVAKAQRLVDGSPGNPDDLRLMSFAYNRLGDVEMRAGNYAEALETYQKSVAIREGLAKGGSAQARADLAAADEKVGEADRALGGPDNNGRAEQAYAASLAIRKALFDEDPRNPERRRDLGLSYEHSGWQAAESNKSAHALELFDANVKLREDAQRDAPDDAEAQRDLANAYDFQGLALRMLKRPGEALAAFVKSRDLRKALVALDPKQLDVQRDLAVGYAHCGLAYADAGDREAALDQFHHALEIREALAGADPGNAPWQVDLALDLRRIGQAGEDPKANLQRALRIVQDLQSKKKLPAQYSELPAALQADIKSTGP